MSKFSRGWPRADADLIGDRRLLSILVFASIFSRRVIPFGRLTLWMFGPGFWGVQTLFDPQIVI